MMRTGASSKIAPRLLRILVPLTLAFAGLSAWVAWGEYRTTRQHIGEERHASATAAARNLERFLHGRFDLMTAVASSSGFHAGDPLAIDRQLAKLNRRDIGFDGGFAWVDLRGTVRAAAWPGRTPSLTVVGAPFIRSVLASRVSSVTSITGARAQPMEVLAVATTDTTGRLNGALLAAMALDDVRDLVPGLDLRRSQLTIVDADDHILVGGSPVRFDSVARTASYRAMVARRSGWTMGAADPRGRTDQIVGFATVPTSRWLVTVAEARTEALASARRTLLGYLGLLAALTVLGTSFGLYESRRLRRASFDHQRQRISTARMRITASRFIAAGEQATLGHTVAEAIAEELGVPWCAIVNLASVDGPTRIAAYGEVPDGLGAMPIAEHLDPTDADGSSLVEIGALADAQRIMAVTIGDPADGNVALLPLAPHRVVQESERAAVGAIVESAVQAFERARMLDRARLREDALGEFERELLSVEGVGARTRRLVELLVPAVADFATVEVAGRRGPRVVAARHRVPAGLPALSSLQSAHLTGGPVDRAVLTTAAGAHFGVFGQSTLAGSSCIVAPMRTDGPPALLIVGRTRDGGRPFDVTDRAFIDAVAVRAGVAVTRARRGEQERRVGLELQRSLLREMPSQLAGSVDLASRYRPGARDLHVGGDWFDAFALDDGRVALCVGDVVGHGLTAAAAMGRLASALRAIALAEREPDVVLRHLDTFAAQTDGARLATVAYVVLDPTTGVLRYRTAGHPPPMIVKADGSADYLWDGRGAPLGIADSATRANGECCIPAGATIVLFSDGLFERRGELVDTSLDRLAALAARHAGEDPDALVDGLLRDSLGDRAQSDDVAILAARLAHVGRQTQFAFPASAGNVAEARGTVRAWLAATPLPPDRAQDILLAVSEALTNAVEHGSASSVDTVRVELLEAPGGGCTVKVSNSGPWREAAAGGNRGRGLKIMQRLVDDIRIHNDPTGTTVTLEVGPAASNGAV